jgi:lysozyme family protein
MKSGFSRALKAVLVHEGGKVDHPADPGGRTAYGVTQRVYDGYRRRQGREPRDVYAMSQAERDSIYRQQYWNAVRGDDLPSGIDYVLFDGAVNSGPGQAIKWLQRALGPRYTGRIDGVMATITLDALDAHPDHDALIGAICDRRMAFLKALRTWRTFGKGWTRRVAAVRATGQAWASGEKGPVLAFISGGEAKANIEDARSRPSTMTADMATGVGGTAATAAPVESAITSATDQLAPLAAVSEYIAYVVAGLTVSGVALMVGGLVWRGWIKRRAAERDDALDLQGAG